MLLSELVTTSEVVAQTSSRTGKVAALAACLRGCPPADTAVVTSYLAGRLTQRRAGVGWVTLRRPPPPAPVPTLQPRDVDAAFAEAEAVSGPGAAERRRRIVTRLLGRATAAEQDYLRRLVTGEVRQGALAGLLADALATVAGAEPAVVRRAAMLAGGLPPVAEAVLREGPAGLARFALSVGRPLQPMLAGTATTVADAVARTGPAAVEWKLDGIRVQLHRSGDQVSVFTRSLDDVTDRLPEVVEEIRALPVDSAVLDGEAIALHPDGRPRPFQQTASRTASRLGVEQARVSTPITLFLFDVLHLDGADLLDRPLTDRRAALAERIPARLRVPGTVTDGESAPAGTCYEQALAAGHEGVVVKALAAPYAAGRRGAGWLKVKPVQTLDLVVLAAEWGHGRRTGLLSNLHLGARDPSGGPPVMLGKTFKGLTDELLGWQTREFLAREVRRDRWVVHVRPELVVEVAFDGVQRSPRYPGGLALRFARVVRYRPDKSAAEADTLDAVRAIHAAAGG
jgi:ATP-dependent DNA ligase I